MSRLQADDRPGRDFGGGFGLYFNTSFGSLDFTVMVLTMKK